MSRSCVNLKGFNPIFTGYVSFKDLKFYKGLNLYLLLAQLWTLYQKKDCKSRKTSTFCEETRKAFETPFVLLELPHPPLWEGQSDRCHSNDFT